MFSFLLWRLIFLLRSFSIFAIVLMLPSRSPWFEILLDSHHRCQPFCMDCGQDLHIECMDRGVVFVRHPKKAKGNIHGELEPPAPGDHFPGFLNNRLVQNCEVSWRYGVFQHWQLQNRDNMTKIRVVPWAATLQASFWYCLSARWCGSMAWVETVRIVCLRRSICVASVMTEQSRHCFAAHFVGAGRSALLCSVDWRPDEGSEWPLAEVGQWGWMAFSLSVFKADD